LGLEPLKIPYLKSGSFGLGGSEKCDDPIAQNQKYSGLGEGFHPFHLGFRTKKQRTWSFGGVEPFFKMNTLVFSNIE
jgi:hypothetical protein